MSQRRLVVAFGHRKTHRSAGTPETGTASSRDQRAPLRPRCRADGSGHGRGRNSRKAFQGTSLPVPRWIDHRISRADTVAPAHACSTAHRKTPDESWRDLGAGHSGRGYQDASRSRLPDIPRAIRTHRCISIKIPMPIPGADNHDGLWACNEGRHMDHGSIYLAVRKRTRQAFGFPINLHRFRHAAATFWSMQDPANVRGVKDLLGHSSFRTTDTHYIMAQSRIAGRALARAIGYCKER
jgi:hypothetical protein